MHRQRARWHHGNTDLPVEGHPMPAASEPSRTWLSLRAWMLLLPLLCLVSGCGERGGAQNASRNPQENTAPTKPRGAPPVVTASISAVRTQWKDGQQTFTLSLTNNGEKAETVHAIVYARNEEISPPRRAISPPTAYNWFKLIDSRNGLLTPNDIERNWRADAFFNGRSGR